MILNAQQGSEFNDLCKAVLKTSNTITFAAIINGKGRIEECHAQDIIIERLDTARKEMFFMENALMHRLRQEFDEDLGQVRFTYVERMRRGFLSFPLEDNLLLVSFKTSTDSLIMAKSIIHLIHKYKKNCIIRHKPPPKIEEKIFLRI